MSMYNLMNQSTDTISTKDLALSIIGLEENDFPRFRDAWIDPKRMEVVVLTRTGGGNRDDYRDENDALAEHPLYLLDEDDDFDRTYAHFYFKIPEDKIEILKTLPIPEQSSLEEKCMGLIAAITGGEKKE